MRTAVPSALCGRSLTGIIMMCALLGVALPLALTGSPSLLHCVSTVGCGQCMTDGCGSFNTSQLSVENYPSDAVRCSHQAGRPAWPQHSTAQPQHSTAQHSHSHSHSTAQHSTAPHCCILSSRGSPTRTCGPCALSACVHSHLLPSVRRVHRARRMCDRQHGSATALACATAQSSPDSELRAAARRHWLTGR